MRATLLTSRKLKITLTARESSELFNSFEKLSHLNAAVKRSLLSLLREALRSTDFILDCERLFVEIFPTSLGGHAIYFTKPTDKSLCRPSEILLRFKSSSDTSDFCKTLEVCKSVPRQSALYKYRGKYYLRLNIGETRLPVRLINEFTDLSPCSALESAVVGEYGKCIIKTGAVETLSRL